MTYYELERHFTTFKYDLYSLQRSHQLQTSRRQTKWFGEIYTVQRQMYAQSS